ncbi:MAG TPA: hypothetical protein VEY11_05180 [Pyrinomonadaceae bacterium]|nr:hypothetical protein [Pyrinomonadaceae bacterium]
MARRVARRVAGHVVKRVACVSLCAAVVAVSSAAGCVGEARAQGTPSRGVAPEADAEAPLTNAAVVKLVRAKFSEKTVIAIIRARPARFDLSPDRLIELKKSGVGERIILTMLARADGDMLAARDDAGDAFDDDPFFEGTRGQTRAPEAAERSSGRTNGGGDPNEVNVFGSSGGVRGRTRSRVGGGAAEGDTQTTGSASVRIVRPPAEAGGAGGGGAEPKLERTPTLTNDSIVELVEAGFSEGTIIRRIEGSPVEFDFAPAKLAELRRRRVGDAVIAAMRAASGEEDAGRGANDSHSKP